MRPLDPGPLAPFLEASLPGRYEYLHTLAWYFFCFHFNPRHLSVHLLLNRDISSSLRCTFSQLLIQTSLGQEPANLLSQGPDGAHSQVFAAAALRLCREADHRWLVDAGRSCSHQTVQDTQTFTPHKVLVVFWFLQPLKHAEAFLVVGCIKIGRGRDVLGPCADRSGYCLPPKCPSHSLYH